MPLKTRVFENGELAVDAEATEVTILGGEQEDGTFGQEPKRREISSRRLGNPMTHPSRKKHQRVCICLMISAQAGILIFHRMEGESCTTASGGLI